MKEGFLYGGSDYSGREYSWYNGTGSGWHHWYITCGDCT